VHSPLENRASSRIKTHGFCYRTVREKICSNQIVSTGYHFVSGTPTKHPTQRRNLYGHYHTAIGGEPENMSSSSTKKEAASCVDMPKSLRPPSGFRGAGSRVGCAHGRFVGDSRVLVEFAKGLRFKPGRSETEGGF
jgi:hypothetical protein